MREYQPIWEKLKSMPLAEAQSKGVSVSANRVLHKRIIKAVIKEKWLDIPYKIQTDAQKTILYHTRKGAIITFYLTVCIKAINERNL